MTAAPPPVQPQYARPGANPTLETLEYIHSALNAAGEPVSRNWLLAVLASWGHMTTRRSLNAALEFLASTGAIVEGPKGLSAVPFPARARAPLARPR
jgi:hypothetical protein